MSSKIKAKIDCCGSNFETEQVSILGLLTLSVPLTLICILLWIPTFTLGFIGPIKSLNSNLKTIINANLLLIEKQDILPRLRCNFSVWANPISPSLSRTVYDKFNIISLVLCWVLALSGVGLFV
ncbi:MAG: hypothetical protein CME70_08995 [Halobacteriovorax sp.]|nr:hypothetical protein [Halobacteriovorax sp.]|tara:strand:+ start:44123 stop:44494 length:372 start_codon:yes stop_codon:yes gene_type:complete